MTANIFPALSRPATAFRSENNLHMQTATWLVSRELTEVAGPWNTQLLGDDDGEYFSRVIKASDGIQIGKQPAHADGNLARQPRVDRSRRTLEHPVVGGR